MSAGLVMRSTPPMLFMFDATHFVVEALGFLRALFLTEGLVLQ